ncbi:Gfo/Idh/MocA family protein [Roseibium sediminis]|uniref:Gfo/Idh/MocA family protein n=1 Tax=Roseibium sediminis TaxID=1775174 RepID=UPI00123CD552|nr:Gfo/Idh/MocA family oxidoreductase [Roseibium sediminis]
MPEITRLAVVGYGLVGKRHVETLIRIPQIELAAIVEPHDAAREQVLRHGVPCYASLSDMFAKDGPDGVILATPTPLHVEQGLECVANGCPVLVEKPIAVTSAEASRLVEAAEQARVPLLVGHHRRHNPLIRAAKAAIDEGRIGAIRSVQATCWFYKPDSYFDAAAWRKLHGAGPVSVNLVHDVDLLRHFCGDVERVRAVARPSIRKYENEDLAAAILEFASGAVATLSVSDSVVSPWSWELTARENPAYPATNQSCYLIGGSEGALSIPDLRVWKHEAQPDWWSPISATSLLAEAHDPLTAQALHFCEVIRGATVCLVSGKEGLKSLQVIEAIEKASEIGEPVSLVEQEQAFAPAKDMFSSATA